MPDAIRTLLDIYYRALNTQDWETLLSLLADEVILDVDEGRREVGRVSVAEFMRHKAACCREQVSDIHIMISEEGSRAAVEYTVCGTYAANFYNLPAASGQSYRLSGGSFFDIRSGKIIRISCYRNLHNWTAQLTGPDSQGAA